MHLNRLRWLWNSIDNRHGDTPFVVCSFLRGTEAKTDALRTDWSTRHICPLFKYLDHCRIPYVYSSWENYYRHHDAVCSISQRGKVRAHFVKKRCTYNCTGPNGIVLRLTREYRERCSSAQLHGICNELAYKNMRQRRIYCILDGFELHFSLYNHNYNVWFEIDLTKLNALSDTKRERCYNIIDRVSSHFIQCIAKITSTDTALRVLKRQETTGAAPSQRVAPV